MIKGDTKNKIENNQKTEECKKYRQSSKVESIPCVGTDVGSCNNEGWAKELHEYAVPIGYHLVPIH